MIAGEVLADGQIQEMYAGEVLADGQIQEMIAGEVLADRQTQEMYAGEWFADGLAYCRWGGMSMVSMPPKGVMWAKASAGEMARA